LVAEVLGTKVHTRDPSELRAVIIGKLADRYAAEQGIELKPEEIDAYTDSLRRVAEQDRRRQEARRAALTREHSGAGIEDAFRCGAPVAVLGARFAERGARDSRRIRAQRHGGSSRPAAGGDRLHPAMENQPGALPPIRRTDH